MAQPYAQRDVGTSSRITDDLGSRRTICREIAEVGVGRVAMNVGSIPAIEIAQRAIPKIIAIIAIARIRKP